MAFGMTLNPRMTDWSGKAVWLIGASSGIGRAVAERLYRQGAHVVVSARSAQVLDEFADGHPGALAIPLDVTDRRGLDAAARQIVQRHSRLDLALYCAGTYKAMRATDFDLDQMLRHNRVNYVGALHMLGTVLPIMLAQRSGHISLVASAAGYRGLPNALAYGPTKAALINLAQTLYLDLEPLGIGVSMVNPGFVETTLTAGNRFRMPALITPQRAAQELLAGWASGRFEIHFPKRFTRWLKLLGHLGDRPYFGIVRRVTE
jgi:NAD(P)-dependent dehydrogenase (short-subunit alcohol dehydrogenase family)